MPRFGQHVRQLFHFTDRSNLASIRAHGGLLSWQELVSRGIDVPKPGGNKLSHVLDGQVGLLDFVHLCFRDDHPMAYKAKQDGRLTDPIYLRIHPAILNGQGVLFTDDVSNKSGVTPLSRAQANEVFDFPMLAGFVEFRHDLAIRSRFNRAKKYEALVPKCVPARYILNLNS